MRSDAPRRAAANGWPEALLTARSDAANAGIAASANQRGGRSAAGGPAKCKSRPKAACRVNDAAERTDTPLDGEILESAPGRQRGF